MQISNVWLSLFPVLEGGVWDSATFILSFKEQSTKTPVQTIAFCHVSWQI